VSQSEKHKSDLKLFLIDVNLFSRMHKKYLKDDMKCQI
jgi:hypothetical protein